VRSATACLVAVDNNMARWERMIGFSCVLASKDISTQQSGSKP